MNKAFVFNYWAPTFSGALHVGKGALKLRKFYSRNFGSAPGGHPSVHPSVHTTGQPMWYLTLS